jgi:predicted dehydrogenase
MKLTRRNFVKSSAATAAAVSFPAILTGQDSPPIRAGLIGCGGRGRGAAENFLNSSQNVSIVALGDLFKDRLDLGRKFLASLKHPGVQLEDARCFTGFDAYKRVLEQSLDLVILATPPVFRPLHLEAAVAARKHVFMEKPVAVDPDGVRRVIAAGEKAKEHGLGILPGTQYRHQVSYAETVARVHKGDIGRLVAGRTYYNTVSLRPYIRKPGETDLEWQLRNWQFNIWASGDQIVEQHVHEIDVMQWILGDVPPVRCTAVGGRQVRTAALYGDVWDHMAVDYEYANGLHVATMCRQWMNTDGYVGTHVMGTDGEMTLQHDRAEITGSKKWEYPGEKSIFKAYVKEHGDLVASIRAGAPLNQAKRIAESTLMAIMGREAAYTGKVVTWDEIMKAKLDLGPETFAALADAPPKLKVPIPGEARW